MKLIQDTKYGIPFMECKHKRNQFLLKVPKQAKELKSRFLRNRNRSSTIDPNARFIGCKVVRSIAQSLHHRAGGCGCRAIRNFTASKRPQKYFLMSYSSSIVCDQRFKVSFLVKQAGRVYCVTQSRFDRSRNLLKALAADRRAPGSSLLCNPLLQKVLRPLWPLNSLGGQN